MLKLGWKGESESITNVITIVASSYVQRWLKEIKKIEQDFLHTNLRNVLLLKTISLPFTSRTLVQ